MPSLWPRVPHRPNCNLQAISVLKALHTVYSAPPHKGVTEPQRFPIPWSKDAATSRALASNNHFNALIPLTIDAFANEALISINNKSRLFKC